MDFSDKVNFRYNGQVLPPPRPASNCFLKDLRVHVVPGLNRWINWYIHEGYFLSRIQKLSLTWWPRSGDTLCSEGRMSLLDHCANTLGDMTLNIPESENILTTGGDTPTPVIHAHNSIDMLPSLPNLRRICWWWAGEITVYGQWHVVWAIAAKQLRSVHSPCKITEVQIGVPSLVDLEKAKDHFMTIDKVLTSDKFPSLSRVKLPKRISFDNFPILKSRGLLESFM